MVCRIRLEATSSERFSKNTSTALYVVHTRSVAAVQAVHSYACRIIVCGNKCQFYMMFILSFSDTTVYILQVVEDGYQFFQKRKVTEI